jgi:hypothetical protein
VVAGQRSGAVGVAEDDKRVAEPEPRGDLAHRAQPGTAQLAPGHLRPQRSEARAV